MDGTLLMILLLSFMSAKQWTAGVLDAAEPGRPPSDYPRKHADGLLLLDQAANNELLPAALSPLYAVSLRATTQLLALSQLMDLLNIPLKLCFLFFINSCPGAGEGLNTCQRSGTTHPVRLEFGSGVSKNMVATDKSHWCCY